MQRLKSVRPLVYKHLCIGFRFRMPHNATCGTLPTRFLEDMMPKGISQVEGDVLFISDHAPVRHRAVADVSSKYVETTAPVCSLLK